MNTKKITMQNIDGSFYQVDGLMCLHNDMGISANQIFNIVDFDNDTVSIRYRGRTIALNYPDLTFKDGKKTAHFTLYVSADNTESITIEDGGFVSTGSNNFIIDGEPLFSETLEDDGKELFYIDDALVRIKEVLFSVTFKAWLMADGSVEKIIMHQNGIRNTNNLHSKIGFSDRMENKILNKVVKKYHLDAQNISLTHRNKLLEAVEKHHPSKHLNRFEIEKLATVLAVDCDFEHLSLRKIKSDLHIVNNTYIREAQAALV